MANGMTQVVAFTLSANTFNGDVPLIYTPKPGERVLSAAQRRGSGNMKYLDLVVERPIPSDAPDQDE